MEDINITEYSDVAAASVDEQNVVKQVNAELNLKDRTSILYFGACAQENISRISEKMLEGVKNKDLGKAGKSLNEMVVAIKGFNVDKLDPSQKPGFLKRFFSKAGTIPEFFSKYEDVRKQITTLTDELEDHKTELLTDIVSLEKLFTANLNYFHMLAIYISAGKERLVHLDTTVLPDMAENVETDRKDMLSVQKLQDMRSLRDDLERRIHDLCLTRQVAMQALPGIRMVQENDKALVTKIDSTLINTVPLWKNQLAQAISIYRMSSAADSVKNATDLTNDLLESNAENFRKSNAEVQTQMQRSVFNVDSVRRANDMLIDTIKDSLQIAGEGQLARQKAAAEIGRMEKELFEGLVTTKAQVREAALKTENIPGGE